MIRGRFLVLSIDRFEGEMWKYEYVFRKYIDLIVII